MALTGAGEVFGVVTLSLYIPIFIIGMTMFFLRRDEQPIKGRQPDLVIASDAMLLLYTVSICVQRIVEYPCWIILFSGYIGTIILCNIYVIRCWTLFFHYYLTQAKLAEQKPTRVGSTQMIIGGRVSNAAPSPTHQRKPSAVSQNRKIQLIPTNSNFFLRNQHLISKRVLAKYFLATVVVFWLPAFIFTGTDNDRLGLRGDACDRDWSDWVLGAEVFVYLLVFTILALEMREVVDGFNIKAELKITGVVAVVAVVPWFIFNNQAEDINNDVFPFSTLFLCLAIGAAFFTSTLWPLYRSIWAPPKLTGFAVPENINTLDGLLHEPDGFESFKVFLAKEFSVENILFWAEVEEFRRFNPDESLVDDNEQPITLVTEAFRLFDKYVKEGATYEVNLPSVIRESTFELVSRAEDLQKEIMIGMGGDESDTESHRISLDDVPEDNSVDEVEMALNADEPVGSSTNLPLKSLKRPSLRSLGSRLKKARENKGEHAKIRKTLLHTVFDDAQKNIFNLMETDSYQRYLASDIWKSLSKDYEDLKARKVVLEELDII